MIKRVVDRVVGSAPVLPAVADVERRDPEVVEEHRVVRPRPERSDPEIGAIARFALLLG